MSRFKIACVCALAILCLSYCSSKSVAQEPAKLNTTELLKSMLSWFGEFKKDELRWAKDDEKTVVRSLQEESLKAIKTIDEAIRKNKLYEDEYLYAKSLQLDFDALKLLQTGELKSEAKVKILQGVVDDLKAKAAFEAKNEKGERRVIKVIAETKRNGAVVKELEVWYVPKGWDGTGKHEEKFPANSSPSDHKLPPGAYMMWSQVPDVKEKTGEKKPVSVGENGSSETKIDLPAPK